MKQYDQAISAIKRMRKDKKATKLTDDQVGSLFSVTIGACTPTADMDLFETQQAVTRLHVLHMGVLDILAMIEAAIEEGQDGNEKQAGLEN